MAEMGGVRLALPKGIAAVSAPLAASRKQIKVRTNKLKREQKKWKDINRALREEQEFFFIIRIYPFGLVIMS